MKHARIEKEPLGLFTTAIIGMLAVAYLSMYLFGCMSTQEFTKVKFLAPAEVLAIQDTEYIPPEPEVVKPEYVEEEVYYEEGYYYDDSYYYESSYSYSGSTSGYDYDFMRDGVRYGEDGTRYTWYSQNVLPGGGLTALNNNGRHVNEQGYICDGDGYIACASNDYPEGTILETPFGEAKVYDSGCSSGTVDIYTDF